MMTPHCAAGKGTSARRLFKTIACGFAALMLARGAASGQTVFGMEFNQANNRFGTINLVNGSFTQLGAVGNTLFNDIAQAPSGGALFGIVNQSRLVTLNPATGAQLTTVNFNVAGIESLAISSGGTIYGATQSSLYTINSATGNATLVGNFNNATLNGRGQNIRFGTDGFLYNTDGGVSATDTGFFRISLADGSASFLGTIASFPGMCLENSGSMLYGVGIQLGAANTLQQSLVEIDLTTLPSGGGNVNYQTVTANFPNNFNFTAGSTFVVPAPEPNAFALSVAGGLILVVVNRRRYR